MVGIESHQFDGEDRRQVTEAADTVKFPAGGSQVSGPPDGDDHVHRASPGAGAAAGLTHVAAALAVVEGQEHPNPAAVNSASGRMMASAAPDWFSASPSMPAMAGRVSTQTNREPTCRA